jgi:outer membrane protein OmpA-like peptidoglycan-associated protein
MGTQMANHVTTDRGYMSQSTRILRAIAAGLLLAIPAAAQSGAIEATVEPFGVAPGGGASVDRVLLRIEEEPTGRLVPLLPYIFFDEGSARIPDRYLTPGAEPTTDPFVRHYRSILAIVGERMRAHPSERVAITGTSSGTSAERRQRALARRRAEAVVEHLVTRYGIDRSRLTVHARGLPERSSNNTHAPGRAENQRVELSGSEVILAPIAREDTLAAAASSGMRIMTSAAAPRGISEYRIELAHDGKVFRRLQGRGAPNAVYAETFTDAEVKRFAASPTGIDVTMMVRDSTGDSVTTPRQTIQFQLERTRRAHWHIEGRPQDRESIVLFDFDSAELRPESRAILLDLVERIGPHGTLAAIGFTDEVGDDERNLELSKRRANTVREALPTSVKHAGGRGESGGHHWNTQPEDRFYSRVVRLTVP